MSPPSQPRLFNKLLADEIIFLLLFFKLLLLLLLLFIIIIIIIIIITITIFIIYNISPLYCRSSVLHV